MVLRWNPVGMTIAGISGIRGNTSKHLRLPWDLVVDWSYNLYVTDRDNHRVQKFLRGSTDGITIAGNGTPSMSPETLKYPTGIYIDINNDIYVADRDYHRTQLYTNGSSFGLTIVGNGMLNTTEICILHSVLGSFGSAIDQLYYPYSLQGDSNTGMLYITDHTNYRITCYQFTNGSMSIVAGGNGPGLNTTQLWNPHAVFFDAVSNNLFIANAQANNIVRWTLGANEWTLVVGYMNGSSGNTSTTFNYQSDVMLDPMGNVYVSDRRNHRIQCFMNGESNGRTIAGVVENMGNDSTLLNGPSSIALDGQLNLYVVDQNNHRIQKFLRY